MWSKIWTEIKEGWNIYLLVIFVGIGAIALGVALK